MTDQLKPCPFCGSDDLYVQVWAKALYAVTCDDRECETEGPKGYSRSNAIEKWNTRIDQLTQPENGV